MRLKRRFVALVVIVMLVLTTLLGTMVAQYAQGGRIVYVAVKTDKSTYVDGENVTFYFVPLTKDVDFRTSGQYSGNDFAYGGTEIGSVHIVRIPDGNDPDRVINDRKVLNSINEWDRSNMAVGFDYFNSSDGALHLSWNGTVMMYNYGYSGATISYNKALAGYYLIYPHFTTLSGHNVKFQLSRDAIFYLDTLNLSAVPTLTGNLLKYDVTVSAPANLEGDSLCKMQWYMSGAIVDSNGTGSQYETTSFNLSSGGSHSFSLEKETYDSYYGTRFEMSGWIDTTWGNYTYILTKWWIDGRWYDDQQSRWNGIYF